MADRYWVGGTGTWNGTNTANWSATSGGSGGASVPTSADDVFFNGNSGTGTVTIANGNTGAKSINCTGFTGTIAGTASSITVSGSITLSSGMAYTHSGTVTINGTGILTTAGKTFSTVQIDGSGITVTLGDALNTSTRNIVVINGTFDTNNYNVTAGGLASSYSTARTINLGSSTVTLQQATGIAFNPSTNLTFNAGSSQINLTSSNASLNAGTGQTFYNVSFTGATMIAPSIFGSNTFNNLNIAGRTSSGIANISISDNQTISGTLTIYAGFNATCRTFIRSNTIGTARTLTCNAVSATDVDFRDITIAGSAAPVSGTRLGDCKGNSGITFPAAKTVYCRLSANGNWGASGSWSFTSGGTADDTAFPLAQDTAIFPSSSFPPNGSTVTINAAYNIGTIDMSARTSNTMTLSTGATPFSIYGDWINGSGITIAGTQTGTWFGRTTQTITSAGIPFTQAITIDSPSGTVQLSDAFSLAGTLNLTRGTFNAASYNVTCNAFISSNLNTRTINMGSGLWTITGTGTVIDFATDTNLTLNKGTADVVLSSTATPARTLNLSTFSLNKLTIGGTTGTSTTSLNGGFSLTELASTKAVAHTISFGAAGGGGRTIGTWSVSGTSGNVVTVNSASVGQDRLINLTNPTSGIDYLSVQDINISAPNRFYVGANSTNLGNNTNVIFTAAPGASVSNSNFFLMFA